MRIIPILFNTDMVRALLEERKSVTRRVVKFPVDMTGRLPPSGARDYLYYPGGIMRSPYEYGDILYVRETWCNVNKPEYGIRYSDAYEVYGLTRTGCCGCPISYKAVEDLEMIRPYEPNVVKAAWNIFGKSYEYRRKYNEYKEKRMKGFLPGQMNIFQEVEK